MLLNRQVSLIPPGSEVLLFPRKPNGLNFGNFDCADPPPALLGLKMSL